MAVTRKTYCIRPSYWPRRRSLHYDDTAKEDEWQREVYLYARTMMRDHSYRSVIDVGCGSGYKLVHYLGEFDTLGLEVSPTYDYLIKEYPERRWMKSDLGSPGGLTADLVVCADVIEHLLEPDALLSFIQGISFQYAILSTPDRDLLYSFWNRGYWGPPRNVHHIREWSFTEFRDYVAGTFEVVHHAITNREQATQMVVCRRAPGRDGRSLRVDRGRPPGS